MNSLKIAYLSSDDPQDIHVWSGSHYSIFKALQASGASVEALGPYKNSFINFILKLKKILVKLFFNKRYNQYHSKLLSKTYGRYFSSKLKRKNYDIIIAVSASAELAHLDTTIPVVFMSDALYTSSLNYHATLSNLTKSSQKEGYEIEKLALEKTSLLYLPTEWVKHTAIKDFKIPESKIMVGPIGANLENIPTSEFVANFKKQKNKSYIDLILVGVNWESKGGSKAHKCMLELIKAGYKVKLTIVGCVVPEEFNHPNLVNIPFINKTTKEGRKAFEDLYLNADFLVLPTKFEAYGIVFCEASAHSVISIATNTGGTSTPIKEGENGFLMSPNSEGVDYAKKIIEIYENKDLFNALQNTSRKRYDEVLNWDIWAKNLLENLPQSQ